MYIVEVSFKGVAIRLILSSIVISLVYRLCYNKIIIITEHFGLLDQTNFSHWNFSSYVSIIIQSFSTTGISCACILLGFVSKRGQLILTDALHLCYVDLVDIELKRENPMHGE